MPKKLDLDDLTLLTQEDFAERLAVTGDTCDDYVATGLLPQWVQTKRGGPKKQTVKVLKDFIKKRLREGYQPPAPRGSLMRGKRLERRR